MNTGATTFKVTGQETEMIKVVTYSILDSEGETYTCVNSYAGPKIISSVVSDRVGEWVPGTSIHNAIQDCIATSSCHGD